MLTLRAGKRLNTHSLNVDSLNRQGLLIQPLQTLGGTRKDAAEQTLSNQPMPKALRDWMREERTPLAAHWNLLTKLDPAMVSRSMKSRVQ